MDDIEKTERRHQRRLNLNDLYALDSILHERSLSDAGRMVSLSQPAMSMALRKLRAHFKDELVIYKHGQRHFTELAAELRSRTRRLLHDADETFGLRLDFDPATTRRSIAICAPETIQIMFLSHVVPVLRQEAPGLRIELLTPDYSAPERLLADGADIALVSDTFAGSDLSVRPLYDQRLVGLVCRKSRLAGYDGISRDDYLSGRHAALLDGMERQEFPGLEKDPVLVGRDVVVRTGLYSALPMLVRDTDMIVTTTDWLAQFHTSFLPVTLVRIPVTLPLPPVVAAWRQHRDGEPVLHWLVERIIDVLHKRGPAFNRWHQTG